MKRHIRLYVSALLLALLLGAACAASAEEYALPQVEITSDSKTKVLDLSRKHKSVKAHLTYTDDDRTFTLPIMIKLQGTSTISFDKKNYTIKFYQDETYQKKQKVSLVSSWGKHSKYCLKANYQDSTHARNIVGARLAADMNRQYNIFSNAPNCGQVDGFPVEMYIDGEYWGLYTWNIPKDGWMLGMDNGNENHLLMCADYVEQDAIRFKEEASGMMNYDWVIKQGPEEEGEAAEAAYEKLNRAIRFVMNSTDEEFREHFTEYFNLDAALNYDCYVWYTNTTDNMAKNMLLATMDGNVWYTILYDLDTCFGFYFDGNGIYSPLNRMQDFQGGDSLFWNRFEQLFAKELQERYFALRKTVLNEEYIMGLFEEFESQIPEEVWQREREKWPDVPGQQYGLDSIRQHIREREPYVDGVFAKMYMEERTYEDPRMIFSLDEPFQGVLNGFRDTGVNLYAQDTDYTIFLKVRTGQQEGGSKTILSNCNNDEQGLLVKCSGDGNDDYTIFFAGQKVYEAVYAREEDGCAYVVIRKQGDHYTFFGKNTGDQRNFDSPTTFNVATNLVLGGKYYAYETGMPSIHDCYTGVIEKCLVYQEALEEEEISRIEEALKGQ